MFSLEDFVRESNRIEGILREPTVDEINAHLGLLALNKLTVQDILAFVEIVAPGKPLRNRAGMNVRVGGHVAPSGGRQIEINLMLLLAKVSKRAPFPTPHRAHCNYEALHPFMDGNGRSGRAIWLWMMGGIENAPLGFLHHFYYQTLSEQRT